MYLFMVYRRCKYEISACKIVSDAGNSSTQMCIKVNVFDADSFNLKDLLCFQNNVKSLFS